MFKNWGKGLMYLFNGALLYGNSGFPLACAIIFWALGVAYIVLAFFVKQVALPMFQGGFCGSNPPSMACSSSEIYEDNEGNIEKVSKIKKGKKEKSGGGETEV